MSETLRGRLVDLTIGLNRKQRVTIELDEDFRGAFASLKEGDVAVTIKKWRRPRSLDANAYAWVLADKIAAALSLDKGDVYREAIRSIGGVSEVVCVKDEAVRKLRDGWEGHGLGWQTETMPSKLQGCTNVVLYYGSSTYDTKQMSCLIDHLVAEAKSIGIETMPPEKLAAMVEERR